MRRPAWARRRRLLAAWGEAALRRTGRRAGVVLVYHRLADERGDRSQLRVPTITAGALEAHLRHLAGRYRIVPAPEIVDAVRTRKRGERFPVAITFDDDLVSHLRSALPALSRAGVRATFFLCGASLQRPRRFWWERLEAAVQRRIPVGPAVPGGMPPAGVDVPAIHAVADAVEAMQPGAHEEFEHALEALVGPDSDSAGVDAAAVHELAAAHDVGFHTLGHHPLTALDDAALARALDEGHAALEQATGRPITSIAYPHGRADARVAAAARVAGYRAGFTCADDPRGVSAGADPMLLGRVEASTESVGLLATSIVRALVRGGHGPAGGARFNVRARVPQRVRRRLTRLATWPPLGPRWAGLAHRRHPVSRAYGFDRGTPIDRHYIARFLSRHASDVRGRVLEVGDDGYTRRYGAQRVVSADVLDVSPRNPLATLVADLGAPDALPAERFDCVICTQTLLLVYDVRTAVANLHRALAPGGVLLVTVPGISRICRPEADLWGDYWRFTSASLKRLLEECFGPNAVAIEAHGNVTTATAMLHGLAAEELPANRLSARDNDFEVTVAARARKAVGGPTSPQSPEA